MRLILFTSAKEDEGALELHIYTPHSPPEMAEIMNNTSKGLDVCPLNRDQVRPLQFAVNSCFRKIFCVRSQTVVDECQALFNCLPISETITIRTHT